MIEYDGRQQLDKSMLIWVGPISRGQETPPRRRMTEPAQDLDHVDHHGR